ncbi:Asp23/Gls24 family envelope stress response protein [Cellulomonas sp. zg-ZUI222]|uniref:Asp23/Gls24 family envelope stress response protein n=1 Tax=Cellulomonas wangleii TaxID=2816956 RepID=A0ABX8D569_9CELL|nr:MULTISPECIES: Asp23/Gls24 family envelope stress response protein [Cellulomonas]MBO0898378.1 Asp23/Gls24 family envelope stress response protein [Cellulomonas sp. zg-ZUI22]MBO0919239.1 Asp23/Gls24 family envelope stress response protein [Cellulomonas wangleii]MBO0924612.1 Asp23/Gls24 family envelope stress response protein [Cellulomonas wangleii]QVI62589.1 Asp23/Gls24 family envelope stress response protein [Cellulomonas wangleii]
MSEQTTTPAVVTENRASRVGNSGTSGPSRTGGGSTPLQTEYGTTSIADGVVAKIAGIAAADVAGVHSLGGGAARAFSAIRERIPGGTTNHAQGISVEVGEREAAIDVDLVAEYGVSVVDLAEGVRRNIITSVERMTGLHVIEVNISVNDVHLPQDDPQPEPAPEPRVA